jgi:hypothetical protein
MTNELCKQLMDAGFPIELEGDADDVFKVGRTWYKQPTLSELIAACGDKVHPFTFALFEKKENGWEAGAWDEWDNEFWISNEGGTPEEAVARLYLALNSKEND